MAEDIKARIAVETEQAKQKLKEFADSLKSTGEQANIAGAGAGSFGAGLRNLAPVAGAVAAGIAAIGAAAAGTTFALYKLTGGVAAYGDELAKNAQRQGISIETLSELRYAADLAKVSFEGLTKGFKFLNVAIDDTIKGKTSEAAETLKSLDINLKNIDGTTRDTSEVLLDIADVFANMKDGAEKTALAAQLFGARSGPDLIPLLNQGRAGIKAYADEAEKFGIIFDEKLGKASERFKDSQTKVQAAILGVKTTIARELLPVFSNILESTADWIAENRDLLAQDIKGFLQGIISLGETTVKILRPIASAIFDIATGIAKGVAALVSIPQGQVDALVASSIKLREAQSDISKLIEENQKNAEASNDVLSRLLSPELTENQKKGIDALIGGQRALREETEKTLAPQKQAQEAVDQLTESIDLFTKAFGGATDAAGAHLNILSEEDEALQKEIETRKERVRTLGLEGEALVQAEAQILREKGLNEEKIQQYIEIRRLEEQKTAALKGGVEASKEAEKSAKELQQAREEAAKSLSEEIAGLEKSITLFDASTEEVIRYETEQLKAAIAAKTLTNEFDPQIDKLEKLKLAFAELELKKSLEEEFLAIKRETFTDMEKAYIDFSLKMAAIGQAVAKGIVSPEEAEKAVLRLKEILEKDVAAIRESEIEAEKQAYIERLKASDSFFDQLKGGFAEFALAVESNGELVSQFFADTLSEMSQNFSDLFFNVLTGKFDDLKDIAKQAFEAILRAFLDMVSAIATRQIVISIAGAFGVDTKGASAGDLFGFGKEAVGTGSAVAGAIGAGTGAAALAPAGSLGGIPIAAGASVFGSAPAGALSTGGFLAGIGGVAGALSIIGAGIAVLSFAVPLFMGFFEKTPRLDIDFDSIKTDLGRRAAVISEILDDDFFEDNIAQISVKRQAGLGVGGDEKIKEIIQDRLEETIEGIQDIIQKLPSDIFAQLNEVLLNAEIDIETEIAGERLLEFDAKGKKIAEKFQAFIEGELPAKLFAAIRESFFEPAFLALGVSAEGTQEMIDQFLADLEKAGSREARAEVGREFIEKFNAFVDAFNIVEGNFGDAVSQGINSLQALSKELGFETVPSIDELRDKLAELIENAEIDPETLAQYTELRNSIIQLGTALADTVSGLVDWINELNTKITDLGGTAVDVGFALDEAINTVMDLLSNESLSLEERESLLRELDSLVDQWVEGQLDEQRAIAEQQRQAVEQRIAALDREREKVQEAHRERLDALNEELSVAQGLQSLAESIGKNIQSLLLGPGGIESPFQRLQRAQSDLARIQSEFAAASGEERIKLGQEIQELFNTVLDIGGQAFDNTSPEFRDTFRQVILGLEALQAQVEPTKSIEEISQEIADLTEEQNAQLKALDARMEALRAEQAAIGNQQIQLTGEAKEQALAYYEYIRQEAVKILEERLKQLEELGIDTTGALTAQEAIAAEQLTVERELLDVTKGMADNIAAATGISGSNIANSQNGGGGSGTVNNNPFAGGNVIPAAEGFHGIVNGPQLFLAGEGGMSERVDITPLDRLRDTRGGDVNINMAINLQGAQFGSPEAVREFEKVLDRFGRRLKDDIFRDMKFNQATKRYLKNG